MREILDLKWAHVDIERGLLLLPDSKTGKKTIVLAAQSMAVLRGLPRVGLYVIAGDDPNKARASLRPTWVLVSKHAGLTGCDFTIFVKLRERRRRLWHGPSNYRQAAWACERVNDPAICPLGGRPTASRI